MEEYSASDSSQLLQAASDFGYYPGVQTEAAVKEFLDRFPLPVLINGLQTNANEPEMEKALVASLERIFSTEYGVSLIPQYMPFLQAGLLADSGAVKGVACKIVSCLLGKFSDKSIHPAQLITAYDIYPCLLDCVINGDEHVAGASMDAIKNFASFPDGIATIIPDKINEATDLRHLAAKCSSLGRVRISALIVKLFSVSYSVASVIYSSNLLGLIEAEVSRTDDTLATLSTLELLFELTETEHAAEFLPKTHLIQLLCGIISNSSSESILRSRAMMVSGRVLSKENIPAFIDERSALDIISAIESRVHSSESVDESECESALEAIGQVGSTAYGAELLLARLPEATKSLVDLAFDRHGRGKQLAALHALANIAGDNRPESNVLLRKEAEESLRRLIYETAAKTSKLTPSALLLSVLKKEAEIRLAGYRIISGLVARPWCLVEICSKQEIITIVTDPYIESSKLGMEARHNCCLSIHRALVISNNLKIDHVVTEISRKLQEAVQRGPYIAQRHLEARPTVKTEQRF